MIYYRSVVLLSILAGLYLCFIGFKDVAAVMFIGFFVVSMILRLLFKKTILKFHTGCFLIFLGSLWCFYAYSKKKWEAQFSIIPSINAIQVIAQGYTEQEWSSGGYSYIRYFVVDSQRDSSAVAGLLNQNIKMHGIKPKEYFLPVHPSGAGMAKPSIEHFNARDFRDTYGRDLSNLTQGANPGVRRYVVSFLFDVQLPI